MSGRPKRIGAHGMDIVTIIAQPIFETDFVLKGGTACSEVSQEETSLGDILVEGLDEPGETFLISPPAGTREDKSLLSTISNRH